MLTHVFERAGLGLAPFRYIYFEVRKYQACQGAPIQPGACCDYCGTGIMDTFILESADGRRFRVGNVCIDKTGDRGLIDIVKREANRIKNERKWQHDRAHIIAGKALLPTVRDAFAQRPHPMGFTDRATGQALTMADWAEWMLANAGHSGCIRVCKLIEQEAARC